MRKTDWNQSNTFRKSEDAMLWRWRLNARCAFKRKKLRLNASGLNVSASIGWLLCTSTLTTNQRRPQRLSTFCCRSILLLTYVYIVMTSHLFLSILCQYPDNLLLFVVESHTLEYLHKDGRMSHASSHGCLWCIKPNMTRTSASSYN
jgi:hypothetical protein